MADPTGTNVAWNEVLPASAQEELRHMELMARRMVSALRHGMHRSRMVGVSTDFNHHKLYSPGDALKHMDWKASARHDRYYLKRYIEDRSLAVRIVLDGSASMLQAADGVPSKYRQAARVAACLSYLVIKERDAVGLSLTSTAATTWLPVSSRSNHMLRILQVLAGTQAQAQDSLAAGLRVILDRNETRGIVAVITDLMYDPEPVRKELGRLHAQGHEVLVIQVRDVMEEDFPFNRWVQFFDLENSAVKHRLDAVLLKRIYREEYQALLEDWRQWARKFSMHYVSFRNEKDAVEALTSYLAVRARMGREK
jgi:uncharacterized protein (DUF58 family)